MTSKRIVVILGHPDASSFCGAIAHRYATSAEKAGHDVQMFRLGEMEFDPILRHGYRAQQPLEPALQEIQDAISAAQHLVFVYPIWWGAMPALLKGMFDRIFLPGYAFSYRRTLSLGIACWLGAVRMRSSPWIRRRFSSGGSIVCPVTIRSEKPYWEFCGIKPVKITSLGPIRSASEKRLAQWLEKVEEFAAKA